MFERLSDIEIKVIACAVLLTPIVGMMVWGHYKTSAAVRDAAIVRCEEADDTPLCLAGIEEHHDDCREASSFGGGRFTKSSINPADYDFCVRNGVDVLRAKRAEEYKAKYGK